MTINTILFDLDGTLIDTNELIIQSFLHTLEPDYPGRYTRETVLPFIGPSLLETFSSINKEKAATYIETYRTHNHHHHDSLVTIYPGVKEGVKRLHDEGYKLAIVTTKIKETAMMGLKLTGLDDYFDVIIGLDDVTKEKPNPEPIYKALEQLHAKAEEAIMVGDNSHDILAAKNAGIISVGVGWALKGEAFLKSFEPDYIIQSMDHLLAIVEER
ncbi:MULTISPECIES: pyrophosphatase PpaX [Bacillaceae]|uniref:Pyrophosphatase PpaX n=1 Tax=Alkalicoccobacillus plakortidis TaxID=444060 RepID=A0A9D5DKN9_9BACI|nr:MULTISPECIES: pyrophosphatase PpaX [Bacillaceae]KQL55710.1 pyrophosphatase [Alkalicoccobacillus plakortidis]